MKKRNPTLNGKARQFQQNHLKGVPTKQIEAMIEAVLGQKCKYCDKILTLENLSLDHIKPLKRKTKKTAKEKATLEDIANTQIICKDCNKVKADLQEVEYISFLDMLRKWSSKFPQKKGKKSLMQKIISRLKSSGFRFGR